MILGVSHLVAATKITMSSSGWPKDWRAAVPTELLPVDTKKAGYLSTSYRKHGFSLLRHDKPSPAIELISYGGVSGNECHFIPVFGTIEMAGLLDSSVSARVWHSIESSYLGNLNYPLSAVIIPVSDLLESQRFWCEGAGFCVKKEYNNAISLNFSALFKAWELDVILISSSACERKYGMLDDEGWNCMSLLVNDLESSAEHLCSHGGRHASEIIHLALGGKEMDILFLRGPDGEIIELLEVKPNSHSQ
ncbi:MAG: hypothetical protein P8N92_05760 [Burkholderiales bacterium]|nr:hypothetical protein [Burkholderiales bacterium]